VRYVRGCIRDGRISQPDILEAVRIRLALVVGGGYPKPERSLPAAVRKAVIARDGGLCQLCGEAGKDIDHIGGSSSELTNLRLLCKKCHNKKTVPGLVPITTPEHRERAKELRARIRAKKPKRQCDHAAWNPPSPDQGKDQQTHEASLFLRGPNV
jgi:5-methylcytosine-specific restriction endonuclease McrA